MTEQTSSLTEAATKEPVVAPDQDATLLSAADSYVDQLVGEGKKYATAEDLAKSRLHADDYIKQLEAENKLLQNSTTANDKLDEIIDSLKTSTPTDPEPVAPANPAPVTVDVKGEDELIAKAIQVLKSEQQKEATLATQAANEAESVKLLSDLYGEEEWKSVWNEVTNKPSRKTMLEELGKVDPSELLTYIKTISPPKQIQSNNTNVVTTTPAGGIETTAKTDLPSWNKYSKLLVSRDPKDKAAARAMRQQVMADIEGYQTRTGREFSFN
jgi:hypothetical protein